MVVIPSWLLRFVSVVSDLADLVVVAAAAGFDASTYSELSDPVLL
jgi:hypothetical protein